MVRDGTVKNSSQRDGEVRGTEKVAKSRATTSRNASGNVIGQDKEWERMKF